MSEGFMFQACVYLAAAVIAVPVAKRLGLGSVLGYLIAGVLIGPYGLYLVGEEGQDVMHFAEFGVVMMLFLIGLELQPQLLWRMRRPILGLGGLQVSATTVVAALIGILAGLPWQTALAVGMILALSSTAIVLQTLQEKGIMKTDAGQSSFAVLLFQDIAVIPMLAILPFLALDTVNSPASQETAHGGAWLAGLPVWAETAVIFGVIAGIILLGQYVISPLLRLIARTRMREMFTAAALLLVIGIAFLMTGVGLSPALGTFLAGVVLAGSEYRHELESDIEPFKGLLLGLFFIAVGSSIDFRMIADQPGLIGSLVAGLILVKWVVLLTLGSLFRLSTDSKLQVAIFLAQGGEFAFVLFSFAAQHSVISEAVASPLIAVVALSMAATPLLMVCHEKLIQLRIGARESEVQAPDAIDEENPVIIAGFGQFGSVVGRLLRANGIQATILDLDPDNVALLRKLGLKVFYGDASRPDMLHAAGAAHARLLILALDDQEKILEMVISVRKHYPHLKILTRAGNRSDAYALLEAGVDQIYRDTLDTSLRVGVEAMKALGMRAYQAQRAARLFRCKDESDLKDLAAVQHDHHAYISSARARIQDLERIMLEELHRTDEQRDVGWDTTSLRKEHGGMNI